MSVPAHDADLAPEIDRLREQFPRTGDLYREVCVLLFFRYGQTPTANRLYQLVRRGSMSAPAAALQEFWKNLREKSRVTLDRPDLPDEVRDLCADLVSSVWLRALSCAQWQYDAQRAQMRGELEQSRSTIARDEEQRVLLERRFVDCQGVLAAAQAQSQTLQDEVAAERAAKGVIEAQLHAARDREASLTTAAKTATDALVLEVNRLREAVTQAEARYVSVVQRSLVDIDRERTQAARLGKSLEAAQAEQHRIAARYERHQQDLQTRVTDLTSRLAVCEAERDAAIARQADTQNELAHAASLIEQTLRERTAPTRMTETRAAKQTRSRLRSK
jgi:Plasmid replication region DNA-binding N-term